MQYTSHDVNRKAVPSASSSVLTSSTATAQQSYYRLLYLMADVQSWVIYFPFHLAVIVTNDIPKAPLAYLSRSLVHHLDLRVLHLYIFPRILMHLSL